MLWYILSECELFLIFFPNRLESPKSLTAWQVSEAVLVCPSNNAMSDLTGVIEHTI